MSEDAIKIVLVLHNEQIARVVRENTHFCMVEYEVDGEVFVEVVDNDDIILIDVIPIRRL